MRFGRPAGCSGGCRPGRSNSPKTGATRGHRVGYPSALFRWLSPFGAAGLFYFLLNIELFRQLFDLTLIQIRTELYRICNGYRG